MTPNDYRQFAMDCLHWAENAQDEDQRVTLIKLARMWMLTACQLDCMVPPHAMPGTSEVLQAKPS